MFRKCMFVVLLLRRILLNRASELAQVRSCLSSTLLDGCHGRKWRKLSWIYLIWNQ